MCAEPQDNQARKVSQEDQRLHSLRKCKSLRLLKIPIILILVAVPFVGRNAVHHNQEYRQQEPEYKPAAYMDQPIHFGIRHEE